MVIFAEEYYQITLLLFPTSFSRLWSCRLR